MLPALTAAEMRRFDRAAIDTLGIPSMALMESAGRHVAEAVVRHAPSGRVILLAGVGNNGGDALVAARYLQNAGREPCVLVAGERAGASSDFQAQLHICERLAIPIEAATPPRLHALLPGTAILVDGLFGTGLSRPISSELADLVRTVDASGVPVLAIDVPSGIDATTGAVLGAAITARWTVTLGAWKLGLLHFPGRAHAGLVEVVDIGLPHVLLAELGPAAQLVEDADLRVALPRRARDAHKGHFGHVAVIAGTPERPGSAVLCAEAAHRAGAGLVTLGSDDETIARLAPVLRERMGRGLGRPTVDAHRARALVDATTSFAIGPSLDGRGPDGAWIRAVILGSTRPAVIDAGALDAFADDPGALRTRSGPTVLTPHPGELARLAGARPDPSDRVGEARAMADRTGAVVLLKGASTVVGAPDGRVFVVAAGNPGMATGGSGDVLAGVIAALLARGLEPGLAAALGAHLHGRAGELAAERSGEAGLVAGDLIRALPRVTRAVEHG